MSSYTDRSSLILPVWVPLFCALFAIAVGAGAFYSWIVGARGFNYLLPLASSLNVPTGLALIITGLSLLLHLVPDSAPYRMRVGARSAARLLALGLIVLIVLSLLQETFGMDLRIDLRLVMPYAVQDIPRPRPMPPLTALCFVLAGASLLLIDHCSSQGDFPAEYCALSMAGIMGIPLIGYLYSGVGLVQFSSLLEISPLTPITFFIIAVGILSARPTHPLVSLWTSGAPGGHLVRRLLPASLLLLLLLNLLAEWGERQGFYSRDKISPLAVLLSSSVLFILFCRVATVLDREYGVRLQGEAALSETNALLRAVSDNTSDAIFIRDRGGRMIFANPAMLQLLGKEAAEVLGHKSAEIYANADDAAKVDANDRYIMAQGQAEVVEETVNFPSGMRTFYSTKAPWLNDQGDVLGLVGISTDITDRKRTETALREHETQLEELVAARTAEVTELLGHLESMREEEKRAIARELHDDLGSAFTALSMHLAILFEKIPADADIAERVVQVKALLSTVINATRRIQIGLRPDKLDIFGIKIAIAEQALEFEKYTGVTCVANLPDEDLAYTQQQEIALFRIVQEALNNIAKHAKASHVDIVLDDNDDTIVLTVRDNGVGIPTVRSRQVVTHGLRGMRERAGYLGGQVRIASISGKGTSITVVLPKTRPQSRGGERSGNGVEMRTAA